MTMTDNVFAKIDRRADLEPSDLRELLSLENPDELDRLYRKAFEIKKEYVGTTVYLRGIIEFSNICAKDCLYCGIRKSNREVKRFTIPESDIVKSALWAHENRYGSIVLQSGERRDREFTAWIEDILKEIKSRTDGKLGITLCLGEQSETVYRRWFEAGAHRYLLRIESSDAELYRQLHPADHDFAARLECIPTLAAIGYQTGTGVLIGVPGQTIDHLVRDLLMYRELDVDMIGMGPYLQHHATPLSLQYPAPDTQHQLRLGLKMIAAARILLKDVNIAATTALQALHPEGRELGILAGANVIMPNITEVKYRDAYRLYENKPCTDENAGQCRFCLEGRLKKIGAEIGYGQWGDSKHYFGRVARTSG